VSLHSGLSERKLAASPLDEPIEDLVSPMLDMFIGEASTDWERNAAIHLGALRHQEDSAKG
jgi:hypothetical protein